MNPRNGPYLLFATSVSIILFLFAFMEYPNWVLPITASFSFFIFYMYLSSTRISNTNHANELKKIAIEEEIKEIQNSKMTYKVIKGLLNIIPSPFILIDRTGCLTFINSKAESIMSNISIGSHISNIIRSPKFLLAIEDAINNDKEIIVQFEIEIPQFRQLEAHIFFISSSKSSDKFNDIFIQLTDNSDNIRVEKMRTDFVANASHELRTPLSSIAGYIETLQGHAKDDEKTRDIFLELMGKQAYKMERLIQDLMSLSRLEVQETKPITTKCSIFDIIEELLENLKPIAIDSKVTISNNISKKMEPITGDHSQLTQMYSNLIENGIKYSGPGSKIKIYESKEKSTSMIAIVVADNGKGISSEHINRLTERFYRANSNAELEKEGTGLGLSIVKHILIRHGGRLQIRSQLSKGSKFITWLPHSVSKKKRKSEKKVS